MDVMTVDLVVTRVLDSAVSERFEAELSSIRPNEVDSAALRREFGLKDGPDPMAVPIDVRTDSGIAHALPTGIRLAQAVREVDLWTSGSLATGMPAVEISDYATELMIRPAFFAEGDLRDQEARLREAGLEVISTEQ